MAEITNPDADKHKEEKVSVIPAKSLGEDTLLQGPSKHQEGGCCSNFRMGETSLTEKVTKTVYFQGPGRWLCLTKGTLLERILILLLLLCPMLLERGQDINV